MDSIYITMNKMRDQQQSWAATAMQPGAITGDPDVDSFIALFQGVDSVEFV